MKKPIDIASMTATPRQERENFLERIDFLIATSRDPWGNIAGGKCRFVQHLLSLPHLNAAVISNSYNPKLSAGCWSRLDWHGKAVLFFNLGYNSSSSRRPLVPLRLVTWFRYRRYLMEIRKLECRKLFIDTPEIFTTLTALPWESICYCFGGVSNPLANSRFPWGKKISGWFMRRFYRALGHSDAILLASADQAAIKQMRLEATPWLDSREILSFPTRVDCAFFRPSSSRKPPETAPTLVACGRLTAIKGWRLLLDALSELQRTIPEARLLWVGDGDEREAAESYARQKGLETRFRITGMISPKEIREYLQDSAVGVIGSEREGWSLAMLEMLASGLPLVTTEVSGAHDLVVNGQNGFVIPERDPAIFAAAVIRALDLPEAGKKSLEIAARYDSGEQLEKDLLRAWPDLLRVEWKDQK
jgi:glycosyltransferase, family 1